MSSTNFCLWSILMPPITNILLPGFSHTCVNFFSSNPNLSPMHTGFPSCFISFGKATKDACSRCETAKDSFTYTSHPSANCAANFSLFPFSPGLSRSLSSNSTSGNSLRKSSTTRYCVSECPITLIFFKDCPFIPGYFLNPPHITLALHKLRLQKPLHQFQRLFFRHVIRRQRQHINVVVLSARVYLVRFKSQPAPHPSHFIRRYLRPHSGSA